MESEGLSTHSRFWVVPKDQFDSKVSVYDSYYV